MNAPVPLKRPLHANEHCRHYEYRATGFEGYRRGDPGGPECGVGVELDGRPVLKCMPNWKGEPCRFREEFTDAERAEWRAWVASRIERAAEIMAQIPGSSRDRQRKHWGEQGTFPCPACQTGTVKWLRARNNGHLWAACTTPDCFSVRE